MPTNDQIARLADAARRYQQAFDESLPVFELLEDTDEALAAVEAALVAGVPYDTPDQLNDKGSLLYYVAGARQDRHHKHIS